MPCNCCWCCDCAEIRPPEDLEGVALVSTENARSEPPAWRQPQTAPRRSAGPPSQQGGW
jgi:hypothetical protein